jgi:translocation and assembly module TamA
MRLVLLSGAIWLTVPAQARTARPSAMPAQTAADPLQAGSIPVPQTSAGSLPAVGTIIPDQEFNAAIPSLRPDDDPELDQPLDSIDEFERKVKAAAAVPATQTAAKSIPVTPNDPELLRPLSPLAEFKIAPVEFTQGSEDKEVVEVAYQVRVDGLESAAEQSPVDLAASFRGLSALNQGKGLAANLSQLNGRMGEDMLLLKKLLAGQGWFDSQVRSRIDRSSATNGQPLAVVFEVVPGKQFAFSDISISADPTVPPDLIRSNLALKVGEPVIAERVIGAEANVALALPQNGYAFAEVGERDVLLDPETGQAAYTLPITIGPRGHFGDIVTEGKPAFGADHIAVLTRFRRGELYDSRKVDDLRQALIATGLFSAVGVEPRRSDAPAREDGTQDVTLVVKQQAGPPRVLAATAGYNTGQGFRAEASWTHRNLFPPEGALIGSAVLGTQEQGASLQFRRSNAGRRDRSVELVAEFKHSQYDAFTAYTGRLAGRISYDSTPLWQKPLTYAYGGQIIGTNESVFDPGLAMRVRRTYAIAGLTGQLGLDTTDNLLDPHKGFRMGLLAEPEVSLQGAISPYARLRLDGSVYRQFSSSLVLAARARVASIQGAELDRVAPSRRLYAGGGGSVRGFAYQGLGPRDVNGDPIGGRSLNEAAVEARYRFGDYGVAAFVDVGQSYAASTPKFSDLRAGVGLGLRVYTNFGPMRIDLATPLGRRPGESRINVYVSIGQAF